MARSDRIRLVVLFGGQSAEHEVSLVTARHVLAATDVDRYDVHPVAITRDGRWLRADDAARALAGGSDALPDALPATGTPIDPFRAVSPEGDETLVVLPLLHGPLGEDGTVQGLLELADVAYVGCGVLASAVAMDKSMAKAVLAAAGIPQARHVGFTVTDTADAALADRLAAELGLPLFVKPANMGSSVGVSRATDVDGVRAAIELAARYDDRLVAEEAIVGREVEVAVLGNLDPRASLPGEIEPGAEFYDYADKYHDGRAKLLIPAALGGQATDAARDLALDAYRALGCEGMARVDLFYEEGGRGFLVNEVNTIPGFTPISMYPRMWAASGLPYAALIDELIELAIERHARRGRVRRRG